MEKSTMKILAGAVPDRALEKERVMARPKGGKSNFTKKKPAFFGKK